MQCSFHSYSSCLIWTTFATRRENIIAIVTPCVTFSYSVVEVFLIFALFDKLHVTSHRRTLGNFVICLYTFAVKYSTRHALIQKFLTCCYLDRVGVRHNAILHVFLSWSEVNGGITIHSTSVIGSDVLGIFRLALASVAADKSQCQQYSRCVADYLCRF